ncbi:hypothetical protein A2715_04855 [Candidatus Woesebacteria bacterium RIFCSPHIGHO2_01_FULL_39_32]|uniref:Glycosyl transferase family 1 domain-containing protein n=1 Tax=Candidatus Woesebacteria bacterium RIFCSPLOWO2_01_FULL_39_25 TaxID=1802521 RepID=A0A1F8BMI4_9BACT|nr:MAG: hypothetical protein A2715_04855 [Candidatus Woesebacteria bacterium RIFCSPHIGHO2_01_FULL_39_32]OGM37847.1 MAG: hypothetical protein A3F01_02065 [Candidatus Woesebacteria bacterium RIFCSPHIGHO2_12_FULL_38_11]OGM64879.1 MAG: hypothetical protein A2893_04465 [Candidatus Woesebacteria bacterium RIFCSPLOWO2_01_FULL_39_25]
MIKIAIDSGPLSDGHAVRGIGVMVREQINALKNLKTKELKRIVIENFDFQNEDGRKKLESGEYDVVHYPYFFPYALTMPEKKQGKRMVVTIQDLIHLVYPKHYPPGIRGKINFFKQKTRLKNVDAVITISETSKKDIVRFLGIPAEKVHVVYLAPKKIFRRLEISDSRLAETKNKYNLPNKFALYVGDVNFNKNIPNLIKACRVAKIPLVICGKQALEIEERGVDLRTLQGPRDWARFLFNIPHPELAHYEELLTEFKKSKSVIRTGFVPDEELAKIFNLASVYVQPSFYEGFGLPVLEGMASGTPVVVARTNALTEISQDAALVVNPKDPKDMAEKINTAIRNLEVRSRLTQKGLARIKDFSWEKTARETIKIYKEIWE